ncbi:hypothetical protein FKM82_014309 [Ascaphus truei]
MNEHGNISTSNSVIGWLFLKDSLAGAFQEQRLRTWTFSQSSHLLNSYCIANLTPIPNDVLKGAKAPSPRTERDPSGGG